MPFKKGQSGNPKGKIKGTQNTYTKTVKEVVLAVFHELQSDRTHNLKAFAKKYPRDYYQIAAKLLPLEIKAHLSGELEISKKPSWFETTHQLLPEQTIQEANHN